MSRSLSNSSRPQSACSGNSDTYTTDEEQGYETEDYDPEDIIDQYQPEEFADDHDMRSRIISYPEHAVSPIYPDHVIAVLTRTSSPHRTRPECQPPATELAKLLCAIDSDWHAVLRRFILQDIQAEISGKNLEHIWVALNTIIIFDLEPSPALLDRLDYHNWDPANIDEQHGLFLESLARNIEWYCPKHLYGSRMREQAEASRRKVVHAPISPFLLREKPFSYAARARIHSCPSYSYRRASAQHTVGLAAPDRKARSIVPDVIGPSPEATASFFDWSLLSNDDDELPNTGDERLYSCHSGPCDENCGSPPLPRECENGCAHEECMEILFYHWSKKAHRSQNT